MYSCSEDSDWDEDPLRCGVAICSCSTTLRGLAVAAPLRGCANAVKSSVLSLCWW